MEAWAGEQMEETTEGPGQMLRLILVAVEVVDTKIQESMVMEERVDQEWSSFDI
jgi:hypothetical protein